MLKKEDLSVDGSAIEQTGFTYDYPHVRFDVTFVCISIQRKGIP